MTIAVVRTLANATFGIQKSYEDPTVVVLQTGLQTYAVTGNEMPEIIDNKALSIS